MEAMAGENKGRRRAGADTAQLDAVTGSFGEGAAHDLSIYLDAITATLALAARHPVDDQLKRDASGAIDQARRLANALADHVRGKHSEKAWVDVGEIVRATVLLAQRAVPSPVEIALEVADVGPVYGVGCELEQMVLNLVLTVRAWIPDSGRLAIRVSRVHGAAVLELKSSGGDRRTTTTPTRSVRTGSLATVRRVLQRHSARMTNTGGTVIRVLIPAP